jgi:hypothetical protein
MGSLGILGLPPFFFPLPLQTETFELNKKHANKTPLPSSWGRIPRGTIFYDKFAPNSIPHHFPNKRVTKVKIVLIL